MVFRFWLVGAAVAVLRPHLATMLQSSRSAMAKSISSAFAVVSLLRRSSRVPSSRICVAPRS
eukprot:231744-Pyramimonas_sp.AAC.1